MHSLAIEVEFGPHWADEAMVWLTGASVIASAFLGWLAYSNGKTASEIASNAADRDYKLNVKLADLQSAEAARNARMRRKAYVTVILTYATARIGHIAAQTAKSSTIVAPSLREIMGAEAATDEATADTLYKFVLAELKKFSEGEKTQFRAAQALERIFDTCNAWAEAPTAVDSD